MNFANQSQINPDLPFKVQDSWFSRKFRKCSTILIIWLNFLTMFIQEHFSVLRRLTYPDADVFIICFSIIDPYSFKRVQTKWVKELSEYCPNTPVVLVGTKYDQRNNINTKILLNKHGLQPVSSEQGEQVARKIGAKQVNNRNSAPCYHIHLDFTPISSSSDISVTDNRNWMGSSDVGDIVHQFCILECDIFSHIRPGTVLVKLRTGPLPFYRLLGFRKKSLQAHKA